VDVQRGVPGSDRSSRQGWLRGFGADVGPKLFVTLVAAGVGALLIPWITGKWQDHKQQLELRTSIAAEMSRAYTGVIITGRFVTGGLVYSGSTSKVENTAVTQNTWTGALHEWLIDSGTIESELTGRYGVSGIASEWSDFANAVTWYMRIGSQVAPEERRQLLAQEQAYLPDAAITWRSLERESGFKNDPAFRTSYTELGEQLLGRGDALVQEELHLSPRV
jgi:hypothetical protein